MKVFLMIALVSIGTAAHAFTPCEAETRLAVEGQARADFPGKILSALIPDQNESADVQSVYDYNIDVLDMHSGAAIATYKISLGETCQVITVPYRVR